uniref:Syntaxin 6/10/61 N-terminal domain-containing protein n=1 Tax=Brassica oleracea var. oleracea TaxID=109376 RepID=A0A0D3BIH2_BRAOL
IWLFDERCSLRFILSLSLSSFISSKTIIPLRFIFDREMTTSLDRWEKDPFFAAAEEVQESADRMESAYRSWIKRGSSNVWDSDQLHRGLHAALGTTKWQLDEFQRAVKSSYDNRLNDETQDRHREFTFVMETQVAKIEKSLKEADDGKGTPRWVRLDEDDRNELALFLTGPSESEKKQAKTQGHRRTASATPDIGAWNIAVSKDGLLQKSSGEPPVRPPRKVPSVSGFLNFMEPGSKNCVRKWKALDRQGDSDAVLLLPIQANQVRSPNKSCMECEEDCYEKQLHGWYGAIQRQLQRGSRNACNVEDRYEYDAGEFIHLRYETDLAKSTCLLYSSIITEFDSLVT